MDAGLAESLQSGDIVVDIHISVRCADFDGVVDVDTLDACQSKSRVFDFFLEGENVFHFPCLTGLGAVKSRDHAGYPGNLSDLL